MNLKSIGIMVVIGVISGIIKDMITEWLWPEAPYIMFIIYNIVMTLVAIAFAIALMYLLWCALRSAWSLKNREQRRNAWEMVQEKVRQWPTGKRDVLIAMAITWSIAIVVSFGAFAFSVPRGRFTEQELGGAAQLLLLLAVAPILLIIYWHFYEFVRDVWLKWRTETRKGRIKIAAAAVAFILIFALIMWGDISGWEDRAWFAS